MSKSKSNTVVEGRIGNPRFAELLREVIENRHSDRLSDEELEKAALVAKGVHKIESSDGSLSRDGQVRTLKEKYGIEYDEVARGAKALRATGETGSAGTAESDPAELAHGFESVQGLVQEIDSHDADADELLLVHDPEGNVKDLLNEIADTDDTTPGDVAVGRRDDITDAKDEKETLRRSISDAKGIEADSLSSLSLPELRRLMDSGDGGSGPSPAPRSGDPDPDETIPRGKQDKAADLEEQIEFLERKNGVLAEKMLEQKRSELESLKGK